MPPRLELLKILAENIKKIQNETRIQLEKLLSAQKDINFDDSINQNQPINIPDGYKFEGILFANPFKNMRFPLILRFSMKKE